MKKLLIVLGMLTCFFGLTACGSSEETATDVAVPLMTEAEAIQTANQLIAQIDEIVENDMVDYYSNDEMASSAIASWQAALEEMGEFQEITDYDTTITEDQVTIVVGVQGTEKTATVTMVANGLEGLTSFTATVDQTMAELMKGAALNTLIGMGTVFIVLVLIMWIISLFGIINKLQNKPKKEAESSKAVDSTIAQIIENEELADDLELVAVIAAAIAAYEGASSTDGFVVRSIKRSSSNKWQKA